MIAANYFPKSYAKFCDYTQDYASEHRKKIDLRSVGFLRLNGGRCIGYCDDEGLTIATKHKFSPQTYVHEFGHMTQLVDKHPLWETEGIDEKIFPAVDRIQYLFKNCVTDWQAFYDTMLLERDCELRAMSLIKRFELPVNLELYAKRANLYLLFYQYVFLRRKWTDSSTIYKSELVNLMSDKIISPKKLRQIDMDTMSAYDKFL